MAVTVPTGFPIVGGNEPAGQVAQYFRGRPVGGGVADPADGQDEATDSLQGINHTWARGRLSVVNVVELYGITTPQAPIASRAAAGWSGYVLWMPCYLNNARTDLSVTVDYEDGRVEVTAYDNTDALIATATTAFSIPQTQATLSLAGLPQDAYLKVRIEVNVTTCKLYGVRAYEQPSTP